MREDPSFKTKPSGIEEIEKEDWAEKVYQSDILNNKGHLYKKPGYNPFEE